MSKTFLYFAYGSNLLAKRIRLNNPTAERFGIGKIQNYRFDFAGYSPSWRGASAAIVPTEGKEVWGAVWKIDESNRASLDEQEGVGIKIYVTFDIDVTLLDGSICTCKVYQHTTSPPVYPSIKELPADRRPSVIYLTTIQKGAEESGLPADYIEMLNNVPHNNYDGEVAIKF